MRGEVDRFSFSVPNEKGLNDARQVRHVAHYHDCSRFRDQPVLDPAGWIIGKQSPDRGEFRQRVARFPNSFSGLTSAELSAMPDAGRFYRAGEQRVRDEDSLFTAGRRKRPLWIDRGVDGVGMVDQDNQTDPRTSSVRVLRRPLPGFGKRR